MTGVIECDGVTGDHSVWSALYPPAPGQVCDVTYYHPLSPLHANTPGQSMWLALRPGQVCDVTFATPLDPDKEFVSLTWQPKLAKTPGQVCAVTFATPNWSGGVTIWISTWVKNFYFNFVRKKIYPSRLSCLTQRLRLGKECCQKNQSIKDAAE